jgi:hypothetical protein
MDAPEAEAFVTRINDQTGRFGFCSGEDFINRQFRNDISIVLKGFFLWIAKFSCLLPRVPPAIRHLSSCNISMEVGAHNLIKYPEWDIATEINLTAM